MSGKRIRSHKPAILQFKCLEQGLPAWPVGKHIHFCRQMIIRAVFCKACDTDVPGAFQELDCSVYGSFSS